MVSPGWNAAPLRFPRTLRQNTLHSVTQIPMSVRTDSRPTNSPQDWPQNTLVLGHRTRDLLKIFGGVQFQVGLGLSLGGVGAISLIGDKAGNPFTATGTRAGAGGLWDYIEEDRKICIDPPEKIPLVDAPLAPALNCSIEARAKAMGVADPGYAQLILDLLKSDPDKARKLLNEYNVSDRPKPVQNDVDQLTAGGNLQVPLIIVQGTVDRAMFPHKAILAWREIMRSGKTSMARLYFLKDLNHTLGSLGAPADAGARNHLQLLRAAVSWAETGSPPGLFTIVQGKTTVQASNCTDKDFEFQPCKCWDAVVQSPDPALRCVAPDGLDRY
jgi:hypothetical protein